VSYFLCAQVSKYPELLQKNRHGDVAVKGHDLVILQVKDIAAGGVHLLVRRHDDALGKHQVSVVRAVQRKLHNHHVVIEVQGVKLTMHVGEGAGIDVYGIADIISVIFLPCPYIVEIAALCEHRNEFGGVFSCGLRTCVERPNDRGVSLFFGCFRLGHRVSPYEWISNDYLALS
jgi:hypothetical protein